MYSDIIKKNFSDDLTQFEFNKLKSNILKGDLNSVNVILSNHKHLIDLTSDQSFMDNLEDRHPEISSKLSYYSDLSEKYLSNAEKENQLKFERSRANIQFQSKLGEAILTGMEEPARSFFSGLFDAMQNRRLDLLKVDEVKLDETGYSLADDIRHINPKLDDIIDEYNNELYKSKPKLDKLIDDSTDKLIDKSNEVKDKAKSEVSNKVKTISNKIKDLVKDKIEVIRDKYYLVDKSNKGKDREIKYGPYNDKQSAIDKSKLFKSEDLVPLKGTTIEQKRSTNEIVNFSDLTGYLKKLFGKSYNVYKILDKKLIDPDSYYSVRPFKDGSGLVLLGPYDASKLSGLIVKCNNLLTSAFGHSVFTEFMTGEDLIEDYPEFFNSTKLQEIYRD